MRIESEITREQAENALNRLIDYVLDFEEEYRQKEDHDEFTQGQRLAYLTILDTVKNQLVTDNVRLDVDLARLCDDLLLKKYDGWYRE